ncbi:MAG: NUDIX hydrolase [Thermoleophilia bacterium]|nr:NUDIX hydrolase [Thermoleophilia bacterium]
MEVEPIVRAAGGLVTRAAGETVEVLLVHRPAYDDWSLPKGKAGPGESDEECALREVEEETGLRCWLGERLPEVRYRDASGRPKIVSYFAMRPLEGSFEPHDEIDNTRWLPLEAALEALTYAHDRELVRGLASGQGA